MSQSLTPNTRFHGIHRIVDRRTGVLYVRLYSNQMLLLALFEITDSSVSAHNFGLSKLEFKDELLAAIGKYYDSNMAYPTLFADY